MVSLIHAWHELALLLFFAAEWGSRDRGAPRGDSEVSWKHFAQPWTIPLPLVAKAIVFSYTARNQTDLSTTRGSN
eukprot:6205746-Amphidinium_carterae.1